MKLIRLILLLAATSVLTGCQLTADLWLETYRIKGGYYDRPAKTQNKPTP